MSNDSLGSMNLRFGDMLILEDEDNVVYEGEYRGAYNVSNGSFIFYNSSSRRKELVMLSKMKKIEKSN